MPRPLRFTPPGVPQHVIQRGNNRQDCFRQHGDYVAYAHWLGEYAHRNQVAIHAWVFMTNHVHLLVTPASNLGLSKMMQSLGRMYVAYFNRIYERTGTLWEGRFRSCLVDSERYLLECYRYIELNPVRAGMVGDPADYYWSSYHSNAHGRQSSLVTPHAVYRALGTNGVQRCAAYKTLCKEAMNDTVLASIRHAIRQGIPLTDSERNGKRKVGRPKIST